MNPTDHNFYARFVEFMEAKHFGSSVTDLPSWANSRAFDVYANTGLNACIEALEANYPSVANWLTGPWFRPLAAAFAREEPPTDSRLFLYGDGFATALASLEPGSEWPYLSELATVDRMWTESHAAADSLPLDAVRFAAGLQSEGGPIHLRPAPSTRWHFSRTMPIMDLWLTARQNDSVRLSVPWQAQGVLLTRPDDSVLVNRLDAAGNAFMSACALGLPLIEAAEAALCAEPDAELQSLLTALFSYGAFADIPSPPPSAP